MGVPPPQGDALRVNDVLNVAPVKAWLSTALEVFHKSKEPEYPPNSENPKETSRNTKRIN